MNFVKRNLPKYDNTCIIIVTYNPDYTQLSINLDKHVKIAKHVIVVDNGSMEFSQCLQTKKNYNGIEFICNKENKGIAYALNQGIKRAISLSFEWILTFDQDSCPNEHILHYYSSVVKNEDEDLGLIGTSFSENDLEDFSEIIPEARISATIITSGTLHHQSLFQKVGLYDETLFIDCVDFDFSIRVLLKGLRNYRVERALIRHHLGNPITKWGVTSSNHTPLRRFYWARNTILLNKRYFFKTPIWILKKDLFFVIDTIKILLLECQKKEKIRNIVKGVIESFKMN